MKLSSKEKRKKDKVFSDYIHKRDNNTCRWCGKETGRMNCSHIRPKTLIQLRWTYSNALCLCFRCHLFRWHQDPLLASQWIHKELGDATVDNLLKEV